MMKIKQIFTFMIIAGMVNVAHAASNCINYALSACNGQESVGSSWGCAVAVESSCWYDNYGNVGVIVKTCPQCVAGARRVANTVDTSICTELTYYTCTCTTTGTTDWADSATGYQSRKAHNSSCEVVDVYRCAAGYYGKSTDGKTGCTRCPTGGGATVNGSSSVYNNDSIVDCYLPSGTAFTNEIGAGKYGTSCYYK